MTPENLELFRQHAAEEHPREACALLVSIGGKETYFKCRNQSATPLAHFQMDPKDYLAAKIQGQILAVCHSHPNASAAPSPADLSACEASALPWYILSWPGDQLKRLEPTGYRAPLLQREFVHGVHDCYALIRDYYQQELGIALPDFEREDGWWKEKGRNLYVKNFEAAGFHRVSDALRKNDVIIMQFRGVDPEHGAIYIGNDVIMQHCYGHLSNRTVYGGYWQKHTAMVIRHGNLL
jgi:proteasome lid subunit RPN8/RPN11